MAAATSRMLPMVCVILCSLQATVCTALEFKGVQSTVTTSNGDIKVNTFWGLRYAEAPVGNRRFKLPELYTYTEPTVVADKIPPACIQETTPGSHVSTVGTDEDCLFLNIWKPTCPENEDYFSGGYPVMVWIHGGGLQKDTSSNPLYNGANMAAEHCIIVVSVNYRLGVFGFLYMNETDVPGNMGLQDVKMALKWLYENRKSFKIDVSRFTLAGNWAGAYIVSTFLVAKSTWPMYNRVILQSGALTTPGFHQNRLTARRLAGLLAARLGCLRFTKAHVAECLRNVNVNRLQKAYVRLTRERKTSMVSVTDGHFLVKDPIQYLMDGDIYNCNILAGDNADEGAYILKTAMPQLYKSLLHEPATKSEKVLNALLNIVITKYSKSRLLQSILSALKYIYHHMYVPAEAPRRLQIMSAISREIVTGCPILLLANTHSQKSSKVYVYSFNYSSNSNERPGWLGATYRSEIPYVFKSSDKQNETAKFTDQERQLSNYIQTAWARLIKNEGPSVVYPSTQSGQTKSFPLYDRKSPKLTEFTRDADINIRSVDTSFCNYWNINPSSAWIQELFQRAVSNYSDFFVERTYLH